MANNNKRKRDDHDTGKTSVGAFTGDTMASALDPFGSAAAGVSGSSDKTMENKAGESTVDNDKQGSKTRNQNE
ncbi:hypothetical protein [Sporosarcina sp. Marseille-Q4943]|uniref:hypothetical protein n=1 Tax=Sporosarcina sp. Marseille-Q4943 TaxID=2942204 RepID=UPI00208DD5EA|nr:hypothetical protein [Sporosarcina sp. Marseille-Q4943]